MRAYFGRTLTAGLLLGIPLSGTAAAQEWVFNLQQDRLDQVGLDSADVEQNLTGAFSDELRVFDQTEFLEEMSEASVMAVKGMGVDYASNPQRFVLGFTVGSSASGAGVTFNRGDQSLPEGGFAFQMAAVGGLNLGAFSGEESFLRRIMVYGSGMVAQTSPEPFSASTYHAAGHIQLKLVRPEPGGTVEWGGLDLTSGLELTNSSMSLAQGLPVEHDGFRWDAVGSYTVDTTATSIPIELSTNLRVFIVSVYAGAAVDLTQDAVANSTINLGGDLRYTAGTEIDVGSAQLTIADEGRAAALTYRGFAGAQLNIFMVKAYGHLNVGLHGAVGGNVGLRVAL